MIREADAITRYYTEAGTPPGRWLGSGPAGLASGAGLPAGATVTGEQLDLLLGQGRDPMTGDKLGQGFRQPPSYSHRVAARARATSPAQGSAPTASHKLLCGVLSRRRSTTTTPATMIPSCTPTW